MFLLYFFAAFFIEGDFTSWKLLAIPAFIFSWFGDVFLLYSFIKGGVMFMIGNIFFFAYELFLVNDLGLTFGDVWWAAVIFAVCWGTLFVLYLTKKIDFKKIGFLMPLYVATVSLHGSLGIAIAAQGISLRYVFFGVGLALFMVSDYFLTVHKFVNKKNAILRLNSCTYFTGMLLAALSFSL